MLREHSRNANRSAWGLGLSWDRTVHLAPFPVLLALTKGLLRHVPAKRYSYTYSAERYVQSPVCNVVAKRCVFSLVASPLINVCCAGGGTWRSCTQRATIKLIAMADVCVRVSMRALLVH